MMLSKTAREAMLEAFAAQSDAERERQVAVASNNKAEALAADERLLKAQRQALYIGVLDAFREWARVAGWDASDWSISEQGVLLNPLGEEWGMGDAAHSLQRIGEMKGVAVETLATSFLQPDHPLPYHMVKGDKPTLTIWAIYDGTQYHGFGGEYPAAPMVLVGLEGEDPTEAQWKEPIKIYTLLEYGYQLRKGEPTPPEDEDIPF